MHCNVMTLTVQWLELSEEKTNSPALYTRMEAQSTNVVTRKNVIPYRGQGIATISLCRVRKN